MLYKEIGLKKHKSLKFDLSKDHFIEVVKRFFKPKEVSIDEISFGSKYQGTIREDSFEMSRLIYDDRFRIISSTKIKGQITELGERIIVDVSIIPNILKLQQILILLLILGWFSLIFYLENQLGDLIAILIMTLILVGIYFHSVWRYIKISEQDLEPDLNKFIERYQENKTNTK